MNLSNNTVKKCIRSPYPPCFNELIASSGVRENVCFVIHTPVNKAVVFKLIVIRRDECTVGLISKYAKRFKKEEKKVIAFFPKKEVQAESAKQ